MHIIAQNDREVEVKELTLRGKHKITGTTKIGEEVFLGKYDSFERTCEIISEATVLGWQCVKDTYIMPKE